MKELHNFIMNKTNAENVFENLNRPYEVEEKEIELRLWNQYLNPCGMPRWYLNSFQRSTKASKDEVITICLEENLIHPIIASNATFLTVMDVFRAVDNILDKIEDKALMLWI